MNMNTIKEKIINFYRTKKLLVWIGGAVLLILFTVLIILVPSGQNTIAENVQYVQVSRGSLTESIGEVGSVEAQPSAILAWQTNGIVGEFDLKIGDKVKKDDVLMELEPSSWSNESLQAQSSLLDAQLTYENRINTNSDFLAALQAVTDAEWTVRSKKEMRDFWNFNGASDNRIDEVRKYYTDAVQNTWVLSDQYDVLRKKLAKDDPELIAAYDAYHAADQERFRYLRALNQILGHSYDITVETDFIEYDQAKAAFEEARAAYNRLLDDSQEISAAKANVQAIQNTINMAKIIAPFDGTVTDITTLPGEMIAASTQAVQLDDLNNLVVNVDVSEIDISKVEIGQLVVVTFNALPYKEYDGSVTAISNAGTDDSGSVQFRVTAAINDADASVKPGFTAVVSIITSQAEDVLLVPSEALRERNGSSMVMLVGEDGVPVPVMVEVGASSDTLTEIYSTDIMEGDQIVVAANLNANGFGGGGFGIMGGMRQITGGGGQRPPNDR